MSVYLDLGSEVLPSVSLSGRPIRQVRKTGLGVGNERQVSALTKTSVYTSDNDLSED
jgi:hypothetical protein